MVAKGFKHYQDTDDDETIYMVTMLNSIRIFLIIIAYQDYKAWQMEIKTIFLNGNLTKDVCMT